MGGSRRKTGLIIALVSAAVGALVVIGLMITIGVFVISRVAAPKPSATVAKPALPHPGMSPFPTAAAGCTYQKSPHPAVREVGTPSAADLPRTGQQTVTMTTNQGVVVFTMDTAKAPCTSHSFSFLAGKKYYDGTPCHRLLAAGSYALQCGDPSGKGTGGPGYQFGTENLPTGKNPPYPAGTVAMAKAADPNSNGSQFFISYKDSAYDGPNYTAFGHVTRGLDVLLRIAAGGVTGPSQDTPKIPVTILSVTATAPTG
jgi:peptidyl-prolyl cis-trans isomerase B (cyclophilin B)